MTADAELKSTVEPGYNDIGLYATSSITSGILWYQLKSTVEPGYNDIGLYATSSITSGILWYQLIPHP
jgi:hypothetical protein